jgi:hypothetical protein
MNIEEKGALTLNITNNDNKNNVKASLEFSLPKELKINSIAPEDIKETGEQYYLYDYNIEKSGFKGLTINF